MKERSLFANSAWGIIVQILRGGLGLILIPIIIAKISLTGYGIYSMLLLLTLYQGLWAQVDLGYPSFLINQIANTTDPMKLEDPLKKRIQGILSLLLLVNILYTALLWRPDFLIHVFKIPASSVEDFTFSLRLIFLANFFSIWVNIGSMICIARHRTAYLRKVETISYFILMGLSLTLLNFEASLASLAWSYLISQIFLAGSLIFMTYSVFRISMLPGRISFAFFKEDWIDWRPFLFWRINGFAQRQSDTTLISFLLGPQFVATYDIAMKIPSLIKTLLGRISEALGPFASARRSPDNHPYMKSLAEKLVQFQVNLGIVFFISIYFFGEDICRHWLGAEQTGISRPFLFACLLNIVLPPASVLLAILLAFGKRSAQLTWWPTFVSAANIILTIPVTYYFKVEGTILLTILQFASLSYFAILWSRSDFQFQIKNGFRVWLPTLAAAIIYNWCLRNLLNPNLNRIDFFALWIPAELLFAAGLLFVYRNDIRQLRTLMTQKASQKQSTTTSSM